MSRKHDQDLIRNMAEVMHTDQRIHDRDGTFGFVNHLLRATDHPNHNPVFFDGTGDRHIAQGNHHLGRAYHAVANFKRAMGSEHLFYVRRSLTSLSSHTRCISCVS
jgi:hypothetical protein